jgi:hypothetical protein
MICFSKTRVKEERIKKLNKITHSLKCSLDQMKNKNEELERELTEYDFLFLLDVFFIYISNVIPFPGFPSENTISPPTSPCSPTHPLLLPGPGIPLHWGIEPSQDQGHPLLHIRLVPRVPPCVLFGWWFTPW